MQPTHVYEVRPRKDGHGFYLISERLPFGRLWYHKVKRVIPQSMWRMIAHVYEGDSGFAKAG
jgi:hypothetical protein